MDKQRLWPVAALFLVAVATACGPGRVEPDRPEPQAPAPAAEPSPSTEPESTAAPSLALYPASAEGPQALLRGDLIREGNCVYIRGAEGGERFLLALPSPGTRWLPDPPGLEIGGATVPVGETVTVTGGESRAGLDAADWAVAPAAGCDASLIWRVTEIFENG